MTTEEDTAAVGRDIDDMMRQLRTRRTDVLRIEGNGVVWFTAYRGKYGWKSVRGDGEELDEPTEDKVRNAIRIGDDVQIVSRSEVPEEVGYGI